jgi:hypothetical protein
MITKVIFSEEHSSSVTSVILKEYNRQETLILNTNLHNKKCEEYIEELKNKFKDEPDDLILLVVKRVLPEKSPYLKENHPLQNTLDMLNEVKDYLQNNSLGETHLTNLPQHFWETLGECIKNIDEYINPETYWKEYKKANDNVWGFKVLNPKTFYMKKNEMFEYPKLTEKHFFWLRIINLLNKKNEKISFRRRKTQ